MSVSGRHLFAQGATIRALLTAGALSLFKRSTGSEIHDVPPPLTTVCPPLQAALIDDYVSWCHSADGAHTSSIPPHLFSQWSFPLIEQSLRGLPWPLTRILNQGCRLVQNSPLPRDQPLNIQVQRVSVTETPTKAKIHTRITTGTAEQPDMVVGDLFAVVPLKRAGGDKKKKNVPVVPAGLSEIGSVHLPSRSGLDYALLTGDFNPIHWLKPAAKMAGFKSTILHGFGVFSLAWEAVSTHLYNGQSSAMGAIEVRFVRPLTLPNDVTVFLGPLEEGYRQIAVGLGPEKEAFMLGKMEVKSV